MVETATKNRYMMSSIFDSTGKFQLDEALSDGTTKDSRVDGENIIGSVEGVFFVPNGFSRNNRFYPCELWDKQLSDEDINRRLSSSIMFGCIGHSQGPVTEQDLSEGKVSHIMDKLWIDENTGMGMGKAYILNTPAGRNLRTYLKAGSNLKVSSRGEGSFAEGVEKDGHPVVEAASYNLITFDFVIEPGFTETNPQLQENYIEEVLIPQEQITEVARKENESMAEDKKIKDLEARRKRVVKSLRENQARNTKKVARLNSQISSLNEKLKGEKLANRRLSSKNVVSTRMVETYKRLGTVDEIKKTISISKAAIQELKSYKSLGTLEEMKLVLDKLVKVSKELNEYRAFGSVKSLKSLMAMSERFVKLQSHKAMVNEAKTLSEKSGKPIEEVAKMIKKTGVKSTKKSLTEKEETKKVDVILETKPSKEVAKSIKEEKEEKATSMLESLFAESSARMFIAEEDDEMEDDDKKKKRPIEDEEVENDENSEDSEEKMPPKDGEDLEDEEGEELPDEETDEDEPETDGERLDSLEDEVDSLQSQIDALTATFDRMQDEEGEYKDEDDFDFEIE